jgi:hypothetical protein
VTSKDHISVQSEKEAADIWGSGPLLPIRRAKGGEAGSYKPSAYLRALIVVVTCLVAVFGCDLVPQKPEAVFRLYRERMRSGQLEQARSLLSRESAILAQETATRYLLRHPPENLALLNTLDPVAEAVPVKVGKTNAIVRVRTLKGGLRLIRLVKQDGDANSSWKIDLSKELEAFRSFLSVRGALEMIREQAGEYAATLKAFRDQLDRMPAPEPEPSESTNKKKIKEKTSKGTKKKKSSSKTRTGRKKGRR